MKKMIFGFCLVMLTCMSVETQAQSLKDILNSSTIKDAVTAVTGGKKLTASNLEGTWTYTGPAVALGGDNALKDITGSVASKEIEKKLESYCDKIGLKEGAMSFTFKSDSTFSCLFKKKTFNGTYSLNESEKTMVLKFGNMGKMSSFSSYVTLSSDQLDILFNADKMFTLLNKLSTLTNNSTLKLADSVASQYDDLKVGFELKK